MSDAPRRRRSEEDTPGGNGGGLPLFPLILVVVFAGLLLGGVLAHFFGSGPGKQKAAPSTTTFTISPESTMAPVAMASVRPSPRGTSTAVPSPTASAAARTTKAPATAPSAKPSPKASSTPQPKASSAPSPRTTPTVPPSPRVVFVTPPPHRAAVAAAAASATPPAADVVAAANAPASNYQPGGGQQASTIVRSYLGALARGDRATATTYLAHGLPSEAFMDASSRIVSVTPEASSGSQYKVAADVQTSSGEYYITFTLQEGAGGLQITDHYAIKP